MTSLAAPLDRTNVDTDQIIPKQFLKRIERTGYGEFLFFDWRRTASGDPDPDFPLNDPRYKGAQILDRRQEFRLRIQPRTRCMGAERLRLSRRDRANLRRHLLFKCRQKRNRPGAPHAKKRSHHLLQNAKDIPNYKLTVSLEEQTVTDDRGFKATFEVDPFPQVLPAWKAWTISA